MKTLVVGIFVSVVSLGALPAWGLPASLVSSFADKQGLSETEAKEQIAGVFLALADELEKGENVVIRNFGKFYLQHRDARTGRNPRTGKKIDIPARDYPKFLASDNLKKRINKK